MEQSSAYRVIDSNLNRLAEGLRVLEDIARMVLDDPAMTGRLKTLRHDLIRADLGFNLELLQARDSLQDVGAKLEVEGEKRQKDDLSLLAVANSRRAQESLRVLEETAKLNEFSGKLDPESFKRARFEVYDLEKRLVPRLVRRTRAARVRGLYVILDTAVLHGRSHLSVARDLIGAGVKVLQLRDKTNPKKQLLPLAEELQDLCRRSGALFILNDFLDVALAVHADGLHIGQEDLPFAVARKLLPPDTLLGCSVQNAGQTVEAEAAGADYVAVGSVFPTASKNDITVVGLAGVRAVKMAARTPLVAIGGIDKNNARETIQAGADSLCVINAVLNAADMAGAARELIEIIEEQNEKND